MSTVVGTMRLLPLLLLLGVIPDICLAQAYVGSGSWCLVIDETDNCVFDTADKCYARASFNGGYCKQNDRKQFVSGKAPWCVVSADGRNCDYRSQRLCLNRANSIGGGCVPNTEKALENAQLRNQSGGFLGNEVSTTEQDLAESLQAAQEELLQAEGAGQ